jgi:transposase InsO family protein
MRLRSSRTFIAEMLMAVLLAQLTLAVSRGDQHFETMRKAKDETIAWLLWYNRTRLHSTLNYVSPINYEPTGTEVSQRPPPEDRWRPAEAVPQLRRR